MTETKIYPHNLALNRVSAQLIPSFVGMLWVDSNNILRVDTVGAGNSADFVTVIPQHTITGEHGPKVIITQTAADNALVITKGNTSSAVDISCATANAGTAIRVLSVSNLMPAITVTQNGNAVAMTITQAGASTGLDITHTSTGNGTSLHINHQTTGNYDVVQIDNYGTGPTIECRCTGNASGLYVQKAHTGSAIAIRVHNSGIGQGIYVEQSGNSQGVHVNVNNIVNTSAAIKVDNISAGPCLYLEQSGSGLGLLVEKKSTGTAVNIIHTSTGNGTSLHIQHYTTGSYDVVQIDNNSTGRGIDIVQNGNGVGLWVGKTNTGNAAATTIVNEGSGEALIVTQRTTDGKAVRIYQQTNEDALRIEKSGTGAGNVISIHNTGSGYDVLGNNNNWWVDKNGNAKFATTVTGNVPFCSSVTNVVHTTVNTGSWTDKSTISITIPVAGTGPDSVKIEAFVSAKGGESYRINLKLVRDGTDITTDDIEIGGASHTGNWMECATLIALDKPGAGTYTYRLQYRGGGVDATIYSTRIIATLCYS